MQLKHFVIAILAFVTTEVGGAKILGIFWTPSRSHHIAASPLMKELAKRGNEVHLLSSFIDKDVDIPTYKQELLTGITEEFVNTTSPNRSLLWILYQFFPLHIRLVNKFWQNKAIKNLIEKKPKYDAIIVLAFFNDYIFSIGDILDAPVILFSTMGTNMINNRFAANPNLPYGRSILLESSTRSFFGRLSTVSINALFYLTFKYFLYPTQIDASRKFFANISDIEELHKKVSLVLVNTHFVLEAPWPYVPNMIQIGGYNVEKVNKLSENFGSFLDSAKDGAILFSLGSNVKIAENFDKQQLEIIMNGLAKLAPIKVVFKSEIEIPMASNNILVSKWLPQNDILAHPNIKLFISHGGLGGLIETVYHGVPILGIPFFADQNNNVAFVEESRFGFKLKLDNLSQTYFDEAVKELLTNPIYAENVKKRSLVLRNRPVKPMDNAIWWVEHIIKNKGGEHLRNAATDLEWYQLYMVDIMLFCLVISSISLTAFFFTSRWILRKLWSLLTGSKRNEKKTKKQKIK
ncbi:hypothetical protein WA026_018538 [Henosepilachna vigintioctopunctata]|uniref:UDP-glucuronosyltransferase n=1 Tax=Henosepilachna vigintioctopunctata TaxID=420089 RepID=A0AAW1U986_9CUCU